MAKKKSIQIKAKNGPFGLYFEVIGGSKESRRKAKDIIFFTTLMEGPFGAGHRYTAKEWESILNSALAEIGYSTEV